MAVAVLRGTVGADAIVDCAEALAGRLGIHHKRHQGQALAALALPLKAPIHMQTSAVAGAHIITPALASCTRGVDTTLIASIAIRCRDRDGAWHRPVRQGVNPLQLLTALAVFLVVSQIELVRAGFARFTQHDVDGACNGLSAGFGRWRTHDLDTLHLAGRQGCHIEPWRDALAIQQNLCVPATQTTHANRATASWRTHDGHTRLALEHLADGRITLLLQFFTTDHDLGGCRLLTLATDVVTFGTNLHLPEVGTGLRPGADTKKGQRHRCERPAKTYPKIKGLHGRHSGRRAQCVFARNVKAPVKQGLHTSKDAYSPDLNSAATLRLGLMLADRPERLGIGAVCFSQTGVCASAELAS